MKIAILETVVPSGHEVEYDRGLVNEFRAQGHSPVFFVPENYPFKTDYGTPVEYLSGGEAVSYSKAGFFRKAYLSFTREYRRKCWFDSACRIASENDFSLIVIPTATPRYLRSILHSNLHKSKVPVVVNLQVFSFEKKGRLPQFLSLAKKLERYSNIHITITSPNHFLTNLPNVEYINPPFYKPTLIKPNGDYDGHTPLNLSLYGFYRHDDNVRMLCDIFAKEDFDIPVRFTLQAVTSNKKDEDSCNELIALYGNNPRFNFTKAYLRDESWQKALDDSDVILAPYNSKQYLYTYSAMCFNALGFKKPVIISDSVNPQLLDEYKVGIKLDFKDYEETKDKVVKFINNFKTDYPQYLSEINRAAEVYSFENVVKGLLKYKAV